MMCLFKRKKKKKETPIYVRTDEVEEYRAKVREAFGSVKEEEEVITQPKCMALTNKGNRCKNNALEDEDYCYRHKAIYG